MGNCLADHGRTVPRAELGCARLRKALKGREYLFYSQFHSPDMLSDTTFEQIPYARFVQIPGPEGGGVIGGTTSCRSGCSKSPPGDSEHDKILKEVYIGGANKRYGG